MSVADGFLLAVRWLHNIAAVTWIGGSLFYFLVLRPAVKRESSAWASANRAIAKEFKSLVDTCILVLVVTGTIMAFDRLTGEFIGVPYVATLAVKISLALWMFYLVLSRRRRIPITKASQALDSPVSHSLGQKVGRAVSGYNLIVIFGVIIFLLSDILRFMVEKALAGS